MRILKTQTDFIELMDIFSKDKPSFIALDTEFHRQTTFYPELSLIQIAFNDQCFIVDALSPEFHKMLLHPLFFSDFLTITMHAARQDLEIFFQLYQHLPSFIFDTQIAAVFLGFGENTSYLTLVQHYLHLTLDKSQQHTEWMKRPLSYDQLSYAAHDVIHLADLYPLILDDLKKQNRYEWAIEEMRGISKLTFHEPMNPSRFARIGIAKKDYGIAQSLFQWRDDHARRLNYNRARVLSDKHIITLCAFRNLERASDYCVRHHLMQDHGLHTLFSEHLEHILDGQHQSPILPVMAQPLTPSQQEHLQVLKKHRDQHSTHLNIPPSFLASTQDMKTWITKGEGRLAYAWRREIFKDVLSL